MSTNEGRESVVDFSAPFLDARVSDVERVLRLLDGELPAAYDGSLRPVLDAIDPSRLSLIGHSFGGATVALASQRLGRKPLAAVLLDVWAFTLPDEALAAGVPIPTLSVLSESWVSNKERPQIDALLRRSMLRSSLYIPGTVHQSHSDTPTWFPGPLARRLAMRGSERLHVAHAAIARIADAHVRAAAVGEPPELDKLWHTRAAPADPFCYLPGLEPDAGDA